MTKRGERAEATPGDGHVLYLPVPETVDLRYALVMRELEGSTTRG